MKSRSLVLGDLLSIAVLTVIGFATHGEVGTSFLARMGTTFIPMAAAWFLSAPRFGLFDEQAAGFKALLRILPAMLLAAPLAVILRAALLGSAGIPLFTLVLGGMNALGLLAWRAVYLYFSKRRK